MNWAVQRLEELVSERDDLVEQVLSGVHDPDESNFEMLTEDGTVEPSSGKPIDCTGLEDLTELALWQVSSSKADHSLYHMLNKRIPMDPEGRVLLLHDHILSQRLQVNGTDFWQSDGALPHSITTEWPNRAMEVHYGALYLDKTYDESYTPREISVLTLAGPHTWVEFCCLELRCPNGWLLIPFNALRTKGINIQIISNYQDGRDSRIRAFRIFGKRL